LTFKRLEAGVDSCSVRPPFLVAWLGSCAAIGPIFAHGMWATTSPSPLFLLFVVVFAAAQVPIIAQVSGPVRAWWWVPATALAIVQGTACLGARAVAMIAADPGPFGVMSMALVAPATANLAGRIQGRVLTSSHMRKVWQDAVSIGGSAFLVYITYAPPAALTPPPPVTGPDGVARYWFGPPLFGVLDTITLHGVVAGLIYGGVTAAALWHLARGAAARAQLVPEIT
jgi:hypothetical protein